ncbi:MAG TPA: flagellar biosynthesis protein FlhA [bacterium]
MKKRLHSSFKGVANRIKFSSGNPLSFLFYNPDIILSILVVSMVGMMLFPLPTFILDILLSINITFAVVLLITSLYVPNAIGIASFPTMLLLTTLFRLSLNVSSTRLILLNGYAGEVINSFGRFVVKGNYIVGGVIFLILTIIQFIVIAKGSERVAEVSARFNLDSMPGKQMSIDADLRTGAISMEEARSLRRELERENQFYGAMDGAMKFVKGDAIAGIIIAAVNIVGGLIIGILQKGYSFNKALQKYTVLTIGDGLVSQIPSLLISTAAGIVITRVASRENDSNIARDISMQISKYPKALGIASGLLIILSILPGLPGVPFFVMGIATGAGAYFLTKRAVSAAEKKPSEEGDLISGLLEPVSIEAPSGLMPDMAAFEKGMRFLINEIFFELGVKVPLPSVKTVENNAYKDKWIIKLFENPVAILPVAKDCVLIPEREEKLKDWNLKPEQTISLNGQEFSIVRKELSENLRNLGLTVVEGESIPLFLLREVLYSKTSIFIGINETQEMLDGFTKFYPALVREVVPRITGLPELSELLRRLADDGIPVRNLRRILESVARHGSAEKNIPLLTELVRSDLKTEITLRFSGENGVLSAYILSPILETDLLEAIKGENGNRVLSIDPDLATGMLDAVEREFYTKGNYSVPRVILAPPELRLLLQNFLKKRFGKINVLSFEEIEPATTINPLGKISVVDIEGETESNESGAL